MLWPFTHENPDSLLDVKQWDFFVVPRWTLDEGDWKHSKSIGLNSLSRLTEAVAYGELGDEVDRAISDKAIEDRTFDAR